MKKRREIRDKVSREFLINLLAPYHPTLKMDEQIKNLFVFETDKNYVWIRYILEEGGVKNST